MLLFQQSKFVVKPPSHLYLTRLLALVQAILPMTVCACRQHWCFIDVGHNQHRPCVAYHTESFEHVTAESTSKAGNGSIPH